MKTIYLHVLDKGWVSFQYTNISELEEEFAQRRIEVGDGCELGNYCKLGPILDFTTFKRPHQNLRNTLKP